MIKKWIKGLQSDRIVEEELVRQLLFGAFFVGYIAFNLFLFFRHEPYRDEANVWLMAKYLSPLELLQEIHYQGHPCLWYFLIMPFAKLGLPYRTIEVISLLIMSISAGLFLFRGKCIGLAKLITLFCPIFTFFYPVVARGYCLIILLLILIALLYDRRYEKPIRYGLLLGLLVQADTIAIGLAGGLSIAWLIESYFGKKTRRRKNVRQAWKGLWLPVVSLLFWVLQMWKQFANPGGHSAYVKESFFSDVRYAAFYLIQRMTGWEDKTIFVFLVLAILAALILSSYQRDWTGLFVFFFQYGFISLFCVVVYGLHIWHFISVGFAFIWMVWMTQQSADKGTKKDTFDIFSRLAWVCRYVLNGLVILFAIGTLCHWNSEEEPSSLSVAVNGIYSNAGETAEFIEENISRDALIFSTNVAFDSSVYAHLEGYTFHFATTGEEVTHAIYAGAELESISLAKLQDEVRKNYPEQKEYYVIYSKASQLSEVGQWENGELIYASATPSNRGEDYEIYRIRCEE